MARPASSTARGASLAAASATSSAERDRQIIGVALLEAERTGADIQHQLEEPGARQRRRRDGGDRQRRRERGIGAQGAGMRRICGGIERHGRSPERHAHTR